MSLLEVRALDLAHGPRALLADVDFTLEPGEVLGVIGPNGAGKSTLLRVLAGLARPRSGEVRIDGRALHALTPASRAPLVGYHPQRAVLHWPMDVGTVVGLGRLAHGATLERLGDADRAAITRALHACGLDDFVTRRTDQLSGGELARVHIARLLAGEHRLLLADEPIANLDPRFQLDIMAALRGHAQARGGVVVVLHDLNIAARHCDRLLLLERGRVVTAGPPAEVLTAARIAAVFNVPAGYFHQAGIAEALAP